MQLKRRADGTANAPGQERRLSYCIAPAQVVPPKKATLQTPPTPWL